MNAPLTADKAIWRILAAAWDPLSLPAPGLVPWNQVLQLVALSNLGSTLYVLTQTLHDWLPGEVRQELELGFYRSAAANTRCLHQLGQIGEALAKLDTPLLLKGAALTQVYYPDVAMRLIGDIDLLVPRADVKLYRHALMQQKYVPDFIEQRPGALLEYYNQERFMPSEPGKAGVELHWHILDVPYYMRRIPMDWFWENTESLIVAGQTFRVLKPEANLIYLPAHLALHHRFHVLHSLFDLALLIMKHRDELNWQKVVKATADFELFSVLRATLQRLQACWPELPVAMPLQLLETQPPSANEVRLFHLLTAEWRTPTLDFYTTLQTLPDFSARVRYAWINLFPQAAYMIKRYAIKQRWHLPYWYLFRLVGGLLRFWRVLPQARRIDHQSLN